MSDRTQSTEPELAHFGKYLLDQEIARGGMSRVFRARLRGPGGFEKKLVVKQILPELARDPSFIELFVKEANTLVQMSHPNLVPVYELGVVDGVYFLAMEWVEGATISELLRAGPLPAQLVAHVGEQIAQALRYAHERFAIIHRDVTPRNVIIDSAGQARLLDFGIAAPVEHTGKGELFGSPGYMPPEQVLGESLGPESDLFALGAVLYEAVSGQRAFPNATAGRASPPSAAELEPLRNVDATLGALIMRMLQTQRAQRPQTAAEVAAQLRSWLAERHPQGVERELGAHAQAAHSAREAEPKRALEATPSGSGSGRIEVRSIATSPVLDELLKHATERIERPNPELGAVTDQAEPAAPDPELDRTVKRFLRDILAVTAALIVAVWSANRASQEIEDAPPSAKPRAGTAPTNGVSAASVQAAAIPASAASAQEATAVSPPSAAVPSPTDGHALPTSDGPKPSEQVPAAHDAAAEPEPQKLAYVTVSAAPWAEVRIDGRALGVTPRRKLPVRTGKHALTLSCPPLGKDARVSLDLRAGQQVQVIVDLHETPAKITVR